MSTIPLFAVRLVREGRLGYEGAERRPTIRTPADAARVAFPLIAEHDREAFAVLFLSRRNQVIGAQIAHLGILDSTSVSPREVFKAAILANAAAVIFAHNHPSGSTEPSEDDRRMTARLEDAGKLLGIEVLDHVIVTAGRTYTSLRERGAIKPQGVRA